MERVFFTLKYPFLSRKTRIAQGVGHSDIVGWTMSNIKSFTVFIYWQRKFILNIFSFYVRALEDS